MRRKISTMERKAIWQRLGGRCGYCGAEVTLKDTQIDHIVPHRNGGSCDTENLIASCAPCNRRKGTSTVESFREQLENQLDVLNRDSVTYRNAVRFNLIIPNPKPVIFYFEKHERGDSDGAN